MLSESILYHVTGFPCPAFSCVVDLKPYQLSCPGSSVGKEECRGFESHLGQLLFSMGAVVLFAFALP